MRVTTYEVACRIWAGGTRGNLYGSDELPRYGYQLVNAHRAYRQYKRAADSVTRLGFEPDFGGFAKWAEAYRFAVVFYGFAVFVNKCKHG